MAPQYRSNNKFVETPSPRIASTVLGVVGLLPEFERRVNRVFESRKEDLAVRLGDQAALWIGNHSPARFIVLAKALGLQTALRLVRQNAACDRCRDWDGAERRTEEPSLSAVLRGEVAYRRRLTDSFEFRERLNRRRRTAIFN